MKKRGEIQRESMDEEIKIKEEMSERRREERREV